MQMKQCEKGGHYYDASIHSECPYCNKEAAGGTIPLDVGPTMPVTSGTSSDIGHTRSMNVNSGAPGSSNEGRTIALIKQELGIDPVVGWLVCIEGLDRGRDYRMHSDNNFIGRSEKMDICIRGDETISRENHAIISFDTKDKIYYFSPGDGRSIVRLNGKALFSTSEIQAYDIMEIGKTKLLFIPLCGERFEWK